LTVLSYDPDTILVPSGENATDVISRLWAPLFSATQLMSNAIILRIGRVCESSEMEIWNREWLQAQRVVERSWVAGMQLPNLMPKYEGERWRKTTWAESMSSVYEGGAERECSDLTDAR